MIGVRTDIIVQRFLTELPRQFEVAEGDVRTQRGARDDRRLERALNVEAVDVIC